MIDQNHEWNINFKPGLVGLAVSAFLTVVVYFIAVNAYVTGAELIVVILGLGIVQAAMQLIFFFHLGLESKPRWNLMIFLFMVMVIILIIGGSMWIMSNLHYNLMPKT